MMLKKIWLFLVMLLAAAGFAFAQTGESRTPDFEEGVAARSESGAGLTAAHSSLPMGSRVRVFNKDNFRTVVVTVESPLEESANRLIVLSPAAADDIGMTETAWVQVSVIERGVDPAASALADADDPGENPDIDDEQAGPAPGASSPVRTTVTLVPADSRVPEPPPGDAPVRISPGAGSVQRVVPASMDQVVITINKQDDGDWEVSIGSSQTRPASRPSAPDRPAPANPAAASPAGAYPANPAAVIRAAQSPARVIPGVPPASGGKRYRVQAGSFLNQAGADRALAQVAAAGSRGTIERFDRYIRVVIPGVAAGEVADLARRLGREGIREIWLRE
jgi:rare lipoprotein A